jgi:DNA polymerase-1
MERLLLIDTSSLVYRFFYALPELTSRDGKPAQVLYGLMSVLLKLFREEQPRYAAAALDRPEPTFRKETFTESNNTGLNLQIASLHNLSNSEIY